MTDLSTQDWRDFQDQLQRIVRGRVGAEDETGEAGGEEYF